MIIKTSAFSTEILSELLKSLMFGAFVVDRYKKILMVNAAALKILKAKSAEDVIGQNCNKFCLAKDGKCPIWDLGMKVDLSEKPLLDCHGEEIPILKTVSPLMMDGKEVLLETFVDITDRKSIERQLEESETKYRLVADNTYDWEFWLSPDGKFLYSSPSCERITGYPSKDFIDDPTFLSRIIHPADLPHYLEHRHDLSDRDGLEFRIMRPDREERWIEHLCQGVYGANGEYLGHRGNNRDITKRKRAEQAATKAKEEWERTFDSIVDPIMILDTDRRVVRANKPTLEALNMTSAELEGSNCYKIFHGLDGPPKYCPMTGLLGDLKSHNVEAYVEQLDGYYSISVSPLFDAEGKLYGSVHHARNITDLKVAENVLITERNRAQNYLDAAGSMIAMLDNSGIVVLVNRKGCEVLGYDYHDIIGQSFARFLSPAMINETVSEFSLLMAGKPVLMDREYILITKSGEERVVMSHNTLMKNNIEGITGLLLSGEDITEMKKMEAQLIAQAQHDPLTGLPNRNLLQERLIQDMAHAKRNGKFVGVLYLDIDRFKSINDSLGHDIGDSLLVNFASRIKGCVRVNDTVARLGGDEFIIVLSDVASRNDISSAATKIIEEMATPFDISGLKVSITTSIGISIYPQDGEDVETLLKKADTAMYNAKENDRNNFKFFSGPE